MTDEEMAEEYADRTRIVDENTNAGTDCISLVQDYEGNYIDIHERIKQAFLAGLKARPQWHDLRKDPNDLPKGQINRYLFGYVKNYRGKKPMLISYNGEWFYDANTYNTEVKVIAWCEIPTFDKE